MGLKKNILANYIGAGWAALMNLAFIPLYIRYLGIEAYGLIGIFAMLQGLLTLLDLGMAPTISREMARFQPGGDGARFVRNLLRSVEIVVICLAVAITAGIWAASSWIARDWLVLKGLPSSVVVQALAIMGGLIGLRVIENIYRSALIGLQRQVPLNLVISVAATLRGCGALLVLAYLKSSIQAFFLWQIVVSGIGVTMLAVTTYWALPRITERAEFSVTILKGIWRFAAGAMAIGCLSLLLGNMDKILLSRLLPLEIFGYYAFAVVVAQTPLGFVAPIAQAFYPRFTQLQRLDNQAALANAYHSATQLVTVLLGATTVFMILFGHEVLEIWTKNDVLSRRVYALVAVLSVGSLFNGLMTIPYFLQLSSGWTGLNIRVNLIAIFLVVPALWILVPEYGAMAAAWVWLALNTSYMIVIVPLMHRRLLPREKWHWYVRDVTVPLVVTFAVGWLLRSLLPAFTEDLEKIGALFVCASLLVMVAASVAPAVRGRALKLFGWV